MTDAMEDTLRQPQLDSLRRDEVKKDRDAWRSRAAETAVAKPAGWLRRLEGRQSGLLLNDLLP